MLSIHSPNYVFMVLLSIFMKTIIISECYKYILTAIYSNSDGVLCFHYSCMRIANGTHHVRTYVPTPPALCLSTPVPRQKLQTCSKENYSRLSTDLLSYTEQQYGFLQWAVDTILRMDERSWNLSLDHTYTPKP